MKKRILAIVLSLTMAAACFTGCSDSSSETKDSKKTSSNNSSVIADSSSKSTVDDSKPEDSEAESEPNDSGAESEPEEEELIPNIIPSGEVKDVQDIGENGDNVTARLYENGVLVISGTGRTKDYFREGIYHPTPRLPSIKSIVVEEGVESLGEEIIYDYEGVENLVIPSSVKDIKENLIFPKKGSFLSGKLYISKDNPNYCSKDNIIYTKDMTKLVWCGSEDAEITIPDGVTEIGERAFSFHTKLKKIHLPDSITKIGKKAFYEPAFDSVTIPESVTEIGESAFKYEPYHHNKPVTIKGKAGSAAEEYAKNNPEEATFEAI